MINKELGQLQKDKRVLGIYKFDSPMINNFVGEFYLYYLVILNGEFTKEETTWLKSIKQTEFIDKDEWFEDLELGSLRAYMINALTPKNVLKEYISMLPKRNIAMLRIEVDYLQNGYYDEFTEKFIDGNSVLAKKSLFKGLQVLTYALQIVINHKITNLNAVDDLYPKIVLNNSRDLDYFKEFMGKYKALWTEFCKYTENEYQIYRTKQIIENGKHKS